MDAFDQFLANRKIGIRIAEQIGTQLPENALTMIAEACARILVPYEFPVDYEELEPAIERVKARILALRLDPTITSHASFEAYWLGREVPA